MLKLNSSWTNALIMINFSMPLLVGITVAIVIGLLLMVCCCCCLCPSMFLCGCKQLFSSSCCCPTINNCCCCFPTYHRAGTTEGYYVWWNVINCEYYYLSWFILDTLFFYCNLVCESSVMTICWHDILINVKGFVAFWNKLRRHIDIISNIELATLYNSVLLPRLQNWKNIQYLHCVIMPIWSTRADGRVC